MLLCGAITAAYLNLPHLFNNTKIAISLMMNFETRSDNEKSALLDLAGISLTFGDSFFMSYFQCWINHACELTIYVLCIYIIYIISDMSL